MDVTIGSTFERWEVIDAVAGHPRKWLCVCSCEEGSVREVYESNLKQGFSRSCGCLRNDQIKWNEIHGMSESPTYTVWYGMKSRCENANNSGYPDYGGRGIRVCPQWSRDFLVFLADMGPRPAGLSIDRIDNDGNYEPGNCRWATRVQQAYNKRTTRRYTLNGLSLPLRMWAVESGIPFDTLRYRLSEGVPFEEAITEPHRPEQTIPYAGKMLTFRQVSDRTGVAVHTLRRRINKGMTVEGAISTPVEPRRSGVLYQGRLWKLCDLAKTAGCSASELTRRLYHLNMTVEVAVTKPTHSRPRGREYKGEYRSNKYLEGVAGVSFRLIQNRIRQGWEVDAAVETPVEADPNTYLEWRGRRWKLSELALRVGLKKATLKHRVEIQMMPVDDAVSQPVSTTRKSRELEWEGRKWSMTALAAHVGVDPMTLKYHLKRTGAVELALAGRVVKASRSVDSTNGV